MTESYGEEIDVKAPVVFAFQPSRFERVQAEKLSVWENYMRDRVGLDLPRATAENMFGESAVSPTISFCPDADDCDAI